MSSPFEFSPLELWRSSSLVAETKNAIAVYESTTLSGDASALAALRATVAARIEALEAFYVANVDDERSVFFEKQRLKLRRLLTEYDSAPPPVTTTTTTHTTTAASAAYEYSGASAGAASTTGTYVSPRPASPARGTVTRVIREDTRLTLVELMAWFDQAGKSEMP